MRGRVRLGRRTKELAARLQPQEIAVIAHENLDAVGAAGLVEAGAAAVINAHPSLTCRCPNLGRFCTRTGFRSWIALEKRFSPCCRRGISWR